MTERAPPMGCIERTHLRVVGAQSNLGWKAVEDYRSPRRFATTEACVEFARS